MNILPWPKHWEQRLDLDFRSKISKGEKEVLNSLSVSRISLKPSGIFRW